MELREINGSVLDVTDDIIIHQVNCRGVMGAGLAKSIANRYPEVYLEYKRVCNINIDTPKNLLGTVQFVNTRDGKTIANLFAQDRYGIDRRYTSYDAFKQAMRLTMQFARASNKNVAIPYRIGCDLAGGNWDYILKLIKQVYEGSNVEVTIYRI